MAYKYEEEKPKILTDEGQRQFLKARDHVNALLDSAGAVMMGKAMGATSGDTFLQLAYIDRLVELGEIKEITNAQVASQHRVFVAVSS